VRGKKMESLDDA